ncbi:LysR family substrate-binding domain-containing protein [Nocardia miyunensis]|uniref:LysR family substrate-binding domain-containing protein n=1 Tax=Nocardia miyunensis TaxID=282684 RepID=UPI00082E5FFF|nr:LysR family substrate-binding domain-containing protein [Nocardia miyunensis]
MLPAVRSRFTDTYPSARLELRQIGWQDSTAGLSDGSTDLAYVWLPLPDEHRFRWIVMVSEPRYVALPQQHPLASHDTVAFADLLDEPFLALPESAGVLREYWLALDARAGHTPRIGAVISNPDETYEALVDGRGICLLAVGNAPLLTRGGVAVRPVTGISPCHLALAWRSDDNRPQIHAYAQAAATVATTLYDSLTANPRRSEKTRETTDPKSMQQ